MKLEDFNQLKESTWPKISLTACIMVSTGIGLCVFYYYYMV